MIKVENLTKEYISNSKNSCVALKGINFSLPNHGMVFICGKSGSGKSTLLNILGGLDSLTSGEITVDGVKFSEFKNEDYDNYRNNKVGFIFQDFCLMEDFTIEENIRFSLDLQRKKNDKRVADVLKQVELTGLEKRYPKELSGGQKQRVAIARALVKKPTLILADEPTGNLDSATSKQVLKLLKNISKKNLVLIISHNQEDAFKYADRIIQLSDGKIVQDIERRDIKNRNIIEDKIITLPRNRVLTPNEIKDINKAIKTGEVKIRQEQSEFRKTTQPVLDNTNIRPNKSRSLSFASNVYLTRKFTRKYWLTLSVTAIVAALLVVILAFSQIFTMFDGTNIIKDAIQSKNYQTFVLNKGYLYGDKYKSVYTGRLARITDEDIQSFYDSGYTGNIYKLYNVEMPLKTITWSNELGSFKPIDQSKNIALFYAMSGQGVLECDEEYLTKLYGINGKLNVLAGTIDPNEKEYGLVITDYMADSLLYHNASSVSASTDNIYEEIISKEYLSYNLYSIKGVVDTGYKTRYANLIDLFNRAQSALTLQQAKALLQELRNSEDYQAFYDEVQTQLSVAYYFGENFVEDILPFTDTVYARARFVNGYIFDESGNVLVENSTTTFYNKDLYPHQFEVNVGEAYIGAILYNQIFDTNVSYEEQENFQQRTITIRDYEPVRDDDDLPTYEKTIKIVGLTMNDNLGFILDEEDFNPIKTNSLFPYALFFDNPVVAANIFDVGNERGFYTDNTYFKAIYNIMNIVAIFSDFFLIIAIALAVACLMLLVGFGRRSVKRKMYEIGVMRALGGKTRDISRSFVMQIIFAGLVTCLISFIAMIFLDSVINSILIEGLMIFLHTDLIAELSIIKFNPLVMLFDVAIVLLVTLIAAVVPLIQVRKIKPINIIRNKD